MYDTPRYRTVIRRPIVSRHRAIVGAVFSELAVLGKITQSRNNFGEPVVTQDNITIRVIASPGSVSNSIVGRLVQEGVSISSIKIVESIQEVNPSLKERIWFPYVEGDFDIGDWYTASSTVRHDGFSETIFIRDEVQGTHPYKDV